jgi:hypothetical protein
MVDQPDDPHDGAAPGHCKKRIIAACGLLAVGGATDEPYMAKVLRAMKVHQVTGKALWPWEVDKVVPEDWLEAILAVVDEIPKRTPKA